ncbi:MAG: hypothetical protein GKC10_00530 [Methanosarcinales archaeon]|nr:hypothetical protein [Methanosarcinales archaeon]
MKRIILALALVAVAFCGCMEKGPAPGGEELNATQIKQLMVSSVENQNSYRFSLDTEQTLEIINQSDLQEEPVKILITSSGKGAIDVDARAMSMEMNNTAVPENDRENQTSTTMEMFFINDSIYMKLDDNWTKLMMPSPDEIWERQNMVKNQVELLNNSELTFEGMESIDGEECYRLTVVPDMSAYATILSEQLGSSIPLAFMNITQLYESTEMEETVWLTRETNFLKKSDVKMNLAITPEIMNLPPELVGNITMNIDMTATMLFSDFNQPMDIVLPEEARTAAEMPAMPMMVSGTT